MADEVKSPPKANANGTVEEERQVEQGVHLQPSSGLGTSTDTAPGAPRPSTTPFPATDGAVGPPRTSVKILRRGSSNPALGEKGQQKSVSSKKRFSSPPSTSRHSSVSNLVDRRRKERICEQQQQPGGQPITGRHEPPLVAVSFQASTNHSASLDSPNNEPASLEVDGNCSSQDLSTNQRASSVGQLTAKIFQEEVEMAHDATEEEGSGGDGAQAAITGGQLERIRRERHFKRFYSVCESESLDLPLNGAFFSMMTEQGRQVVAVVGCGDYGVALAKRLQLAGFHVLLVTRNTRNTRSRLAALGVTLPAAPEVPVTAAAGEAINTAAPSTDVTGRGVLELVSYEEGLPRANVAIVTVASRHYSKLPMQLMASKVLVDVSNKEPTTRPGWTSNAEYLQRLVPSAVVVKSLNTIPLWALQQQEMTISRQNPTCSEQLWAVEVVQEMLHQAGLPSTRRSGLAEARALERAPLRFFPGCSVAFPIILAVVTFFAVLALFRNQLCDMLFGPPRWSNAAFDYFLIGNTLQVCGLSVLSLLTLTYLPGVLAGYLQLWRGTKYRAFPAFLDGWLKARKHLGLASLLLVALHAMCVLVSASAYDDTLRQKDESWMRPTYTGIGVIGLLVLSVQGLFSLPSLGERLSWSESQFVLSRLGWLAFLLATTHVLLKEWHELLEGNLKCHVLPQGSQLVMVPALATIAGKLLLLVPCIDSALTRIRQGYDRLPVSVV